MFSQEKRDDHLFLDLSDRGSFLGVVFWTPVGPITCVPRTWPGPCSAGFPVPAPVSRRVRRPDSRLESLQKMLEESHKMLAQLKETSQIGWVTGVTPSQTEGGGGTFTNR